MSNMEKEAETAEENLARCLTLVEKKLNWGNSETWTTRDFESLSEKIFQETKVTLSVATLKRLWGKMKYDSKPTTSTLDALAQFVGYENWRALSANGHEREVQTHLNGATHKNLNRDSKKSDSKGKYIWGLAIITLAIIIYYSFSFYREGSSEPTPANFEFKSVKVVSKGVPNSVLFDYDATAANENDTVYIQQSWDPSLRQQVSRESKTHNSIYYYPGFFQAKLVINNSIVKEHNLIIESDGWLPIAEQTGVPIYFNSSDARLEGAFGLTREKIEEKKISLLPETPWVRYYFVRDFENLFVNNFLLETEIKSLFNEGTGVCQLSEIIILYESSAIKIPLSIAGCVSKLSPYPEPKNINQASLGCDFSTWANVKCEMKEGAAMVFINNVQSYNFNIDVKEKIVGLIYRFQGTGAINFVKLAGADGEEKLVEDF